MRLLHILLLVLFGVIFISDAEFIKGIGPISRLIASIPDLLSIIIAVTVMVFFGANKRLDMPGKYLAIGFIISLHLLVGVLINTVQPGAVFAGIRVYFKYLPLFILPMVIIFTDRDIMRYFVYVLVLSLLQFPIVIYQRIFEFSGGTGDVVRGSLTSSGILSIYLISVIAVLTAFYVRKHISRLNYGILLVILFIPTTINETKSTLILLPLALLTPILFDATRNQLERFQKLVPVTVIGVMLIGVFVAIYDQNWGKDGSSILGFLTKGEVFDMLYKEQEPGRGYDTGRIDSIVLALRELSDDPVHVAVGLGMGNVAISFSRVLAGEHEEYADYGVRVTTIAYLLWETGIIGVLLVFVFLYFLFRDAKSLKHHHDFIGTMSLAWCVVILIMMVSMFYKTLLDQNIISYLFWFLSGHVVAESVRRKAI